MADLIWNWKNKDYKATPITIADWDLLGSYLKGYLLSDLKYVEDFEMRLQTQAWIQMRDYDMDDIRRHWGRKDMRHKVTATIFKNDAKVNDTLITEFEADDTLTKGHALSFSLFIKSVLKLSGVIFAEDVQENPTKRIEGQPLVESE